MKYIILFSLLFAFHEKSFATACAHTYKNCIASSAKRQFLYFSPVCVMQATCETYCGMIQGSRVPRTLYCKFQDNNPNRCLPPDQCAADESIVKSQDDVEELTDFQRTPGFVPKNHKSTPGARR